jgi:hypothetical protein
VKPAAISPLPGVATVTISVGTFDDLRGGDAQPVDRNPSIDCADCGEPFGWRDYWKPRVVEGERVDEPNSDEPWRCDDCHERHERLKRREENNQPLTAFRNGSQAGDGE